MFPDALARLQAENAELRTRLREAEDTLNAIRNGGVDALVVDNQVYMLTSAEAASNQIRGRALATVSDAVVMLDNQDRVTWLNEAAERLYGVRLAEVLGRPHTELYERRWLRPEDEAESQRLLLATGHWRGEEIHLTRAGTQLHVESAFNVLRGESGAATGMLAAIRDVTERKHAEEALREADRKKDEFLATLAHELRNPLAPIGNGLHIMKLAGGDLAMMQQARVMMERQVEQMTRLIDDLMDVSRISRGKIVLHKERTRLADAIGNAVDSVRPMIDAGGHELLLEVPAEPIHLDGDPLRLSQIFTNLLNNAAKYTDRGGRIHLAVQRLEGEVLVSVEDNGVGIPAHMLTQVFEMFAQVDSSLERSRGGLGIGLNIVKRLVEKHGGSITAQSGGRGQGSRFNVRLPVLADAAESRVNGPALVEAGPRMRILVVDDNVDGATSLAEMLAIMGHETRSTHDGLEAVVQAAAFKPDVILMDIGMPRLNGFETCRRIREQEWGRNIVVVAQTGWGQDEDKRKSQAAGFDAHLVKPVDYNAVANLLSSLPRLRSQH